MTYVYDILLNFTDEGRLILFFEWNDSDYIDHVKKIPFFRVSSKVLDDIVNYDIKFDKKFVSSIKGLTSCYKSTDDLNYCFLVSDLNTVIGVELDSKGNIISRSSLLLQEEEEVIDEISDTEVSNLNYIKGNKSNNDLYLTREELYKKKVLLKEIEVSYKLKEYDKISFYFDEVSNKKNLSIEDKFLILKNDITNNYSNKFNKLYDFICLVHNTYKSV